MPLPISWVDALFTRLDAIYGSKFHAMWAGSDIKGVKEVWADTLGTVSGETLKVALAELAKNNPYPPTLPEFFALCKQFRVTPKVDLLGHAHTINSELAQENLKKIHEMLSKSKMLLVDD